MIVLNGKKFAKGEKEFVESLFQANGTCVGFFKAHKSSITLFNAQKEKIGVINRHGCLCAATIIDGRYWYNFATIKEIGRYESYLQSVDEPRQALKEHCGIAA